MPEDSLAKLIPAAASTVIDAPVSAIEQVAGSVTNADYSICYAGGQRVLIKIAPPDQLASEVWALARAAEAGVPVPPVLRYVDRPAELPVPYLALGWLDDERPPSEASLRAAGRAIRTTHAISVTGFGPIRITGDPRLRESARGAFESWADFGVSLLDDLDCVVEVGLLGRPEGVRLADLASNFRLSRLAARSPVLLHGDLKALHVLSAGDRLTGIIDWGDAQAGDPAWDLARASMMDRNHFAAFLDGYGLELTAELDDLLRGYRMLWNARTLADEYRAGGDWFAAYQDRIAADLS